MEPSVHKRVETEKFRATDDGPELTFTQIWRSAPIPLTGGSRLMFLRGTVEMAEKAGDQACLSALQRQIAKAEAADDIG